MSQDVEESSERCEEMMIQEVHAVPFRYEGRMEESGRWVAQVFGFEAHVALRGRRIHMQHERNVLLRAAEKENEFLKGRVISEIQPQSTSYESVLREQEVQYQQTSQRFKVIEFHEGRLRIQSQTEESMIFSIKTKLCRVIRKWVAGHEAVSRTSDISSRYFVGSKRRL